MKFILQIINSRIFITVIAVVFLALWLRTCQVSKQTAANFDDNLRIARDSTKHFRDKSGQLVSEKETMVVTIDDLNNRAQSLGIDKNKLESEIGNLKNLNSYYKGQLVAKGEGGIKGHDSTIVTVNEKKDTVKRVVKAFPKFDNGFLSLYDVVYDPVIDSLHFKYGYKVDFELVNFRKKHKFLFFGKTQTVADVRLSDPKAQMINVQSFTVALPGKKFYEQTWFHLVVGFGLGAYVITR